MHLSAPQIQPIHTPIYPIEDMPHLNERLMRTGKKAVIDRIRYSGRINTTPQPKCRNLTNTLLDFMQRHEAYVGGPVDDIIQGIARLDHHQSALSTPLSVSRLYAMLQTMPLINTREVSSMLDVDTRQAQKYVKALKLCIFHIERHNKKVRESSTEVDTYSL